MHLGLMLPAKPDLSWTLARQLGVRHVITKAAPELTGLPDPSHFQSLQTIRDRFQEAGLELYALEGDEFDMSRIKLGLPGAEEDLDKYCRMVENMGRLGLKVLCYNFMAGVGWYRSRTDLQERGGALTSGFDLREVDQTIPLKITPERIWENYHRFLERVLPVAEAAGIQMALHPDDPPIPQLLGYARIFIHADAYRKALALSASPSHTITFCQATFRTMGEDVFALLKEFGPRIAFLHFRDVIGTRECFRETFHDNGPTDMAELLTLAHRYAPHCLLRPDHTPTMAGESNEKVGYTMQGNLFAVGYIKGLLDARGIPVD